MLKKAFAVLTMVVAGLLAVQPASASAAGPLPAAGSAPAARHGQGDDQGQGEDQGQDGNDQGQDQGNGHGYVPSGSITITGLPIPGGTITIIFAPGSFRPGEHVTVIVGGRVVGFSGHRVTLGAVKADVPATAGLDKPAAADGSLKVTMTLPEGAAGTQTVTATGVASGTVGTAATTVVPQDAAQNLAPLSPASAVTSVPVYLLWAGAGALVLGIAAVAGLGMARRRKPTL
ncbi:MAG TPA: hypothetical protein VJQ61_10070 [Sinomonas sp.]|nr:hypothetical protein [Sinomonas sp.]